MHHVRRTALKVSSKLVCGAEQRGFCVYAQAGPSGSLTKDRVDLIRKQRSNRRSPGIVAQVA